MNIFSKIGAFFKMIGKKLGGALVSVGKHITEAQFDAALAYAQQAVTMFTDNANRRTWVKHQLMQELHLSENMAGIALELAVHTLKQGEQKLFAELDDLLTPPSQETDRETNPSPIQDQPPMGDPIADPSGDPTAPAQTSEPIADPIPEPESAPESAPVADPVS